jgi:hypothetical protein
VIELPRLEDNITGELTPPERSVQNPKSLERIVAARNSTPAANPERLYQSFEMPPVLQPDGVSTFKVRGPGELGISRVQISMLVGDVIE